MPEQNEDLRSPAEWESHEGIRVANRSVYEVDGRTDKSLIDYQTYKGITEGLTVSRVPKLDSLDAGWLAIGTITGDRIAARSIPLQTLIIEEQK